MSDEEVDYERERISTEYDRTRTRKMAPAFAGGDIVAHWPCRSGCGEIVSITSDAAEVMVVFNRQLRKIREPVIDTARTVFCDECAAKGRILGAKAAEQNRQAIASRLKRAREGAIGSELAKIREELIKLELPDTDGVLAAIAAKREEPSRPAKRSYR